MPELFEQPMMLIPNRVFRSYPGGREMDRFRGIEPPADDECPEAWVGSTTTNRMNPNRRINRDAPVDTRYGIAQVDTGNGVLVYMDDLVAGNPAAFLGERHACVFGSNPGILVKLLDARDQLHLQAHPTREVARSHFHSDFGKVESWYMLDTRKDSKEKPYILMGFKEGISKADFEELYVKQDIQAMDDCCHKFEVSAGEMYFIEAGLPHAVGPGCFMIEVQEPTDLGVSSNIWSERSGPRYELIKQQVLNCIDFTGRSREETLGLFRIEPEIIRQTPNGTETLLLGKRQTPYFSLTRLDVTGAYRDVVRDSFSIAIVTSGEGELVTPSGVMKLKKADELFLPAGIRDAVWKAGPEGLSVVRSYPEGDLMNLPEVIGMGTCCVDLLACVDEIPPSNGATLLEQYSWQGGGKVPTALVTLACLGASCGVIGKVAGDRFGQFCLNDFHHHGIDTSRIRIQEDGKTAFAIVVSEGKKKSRTFLKTNGQVGRMTEQDLDPAYFSQCRFLHLEHANEMEIRAAILAHEKGGRVVFDADRYWPGMERIIPYTDVFIASEDYIQKAYPDGKMEDNMRQIQAQGPGIVVVTLGAKGCALLDGSAYSEVPGFSVPVADTTGAGDVFHGAFIYGLLQNWPSEKIARFASAVAAIKCTRVGGRAGIPSRAVAEAFIETGEIDYSEIDQRVLYYEDALFRTALG